MPTTVLIVDEGYEVVVEARDGAEALHVTSIFGKLGLAPGAETHRRVPAVLAYVRA